MKALMSVTVGGPETLEIREAPTPQPGKGQVLIAVKAASVNFPDTLIIRDLYQFKAERPFAPGTEIAGVIEAVGEGVERLIGLLANDPAWEIRVQAAAALGRAPAESARPALLAAIEDPVEFVRTAASKSLEELD